MPVCHNECLPTRAAKRIASPGKPSTLVQRVERLAITLNGGEAMSTLSNRLDRLEQAARTGCVFVWAHHTQADEQAKALEG